MHVQLNISTDFSIDNIKELPKFKLIMEGLNMKINKSELARQLNVDRRTIDKYLNGFVKKGSRKKRSKIDAFYEVIRLLLSEESIQKFYYKRVLWQYLKDNNGLECSESAFRAYISRNPEFQAYFTDGKRTRVSSTVVRYETHPGEQAQFDWKESIRYITKDGEILMVNVGVLLLSYSRYRTYYLSLSRSQSVLLSFLTESFDSFGGVPKTILTDNLKTVMDEHRTEHSKGVVNERFEQFANDYGFIVKPCIAGRPQTKGKVESTMKLLDEIHAYQGKFDFKELSDYIQRLNERVNHQVSQGTGSIPILMLKKERSHLLPLPRKDISDSYKIDHNLVKVNPAGMIPYQSNHYSVGTEYIGQRVGLQVYDNQLYIYYNMKLLVTHPLVKKRLNYKDEHYKQALSQIVSSYEDIDELARKNLCAMDEVYKID